MAKTPQQSAWDAKLTADKRQDLAQWLCTEIENADAARSIPLPEIEYWWTLYEQGRTRTGQAQPWQDAADLTSFIITEKVDALRARIMRTVFVDPVYTVEGWGDSARKAPFVEDFHQWQIESEGLQSVLSRVIHASLIETRGVLEVYEDTTLRTKRRDIQAAIELTPDGQFKLDKDLQPVLQKDESGNYVEVTDTEGGVVGTAQVVIDEQERVRKGPGYRVLDAKHFLVLPSHAREKADIWGYAKYFTRRYPLLEADAKRGVYDAKAVEAINASNEKTDERTLSGAPAPVVAQEGPTAEKELWEVQFLSDLDGKGQRWYVATVHVPSRTLLRLKHEDLARSRYVIFVPFPRPDRAHEGYSFAGHKLITIAEEHTAWRNMLADRASMEISAPIKRQTGALWDPDLQPFGPKAVIDVRDMKEIEAFQLPPAMNGAINREQEIVQASERVAGINDVALGQVPQNSRTLGEVNLVAEQSFVRMDEVIKNLQESLEDLGQIRHAIWVNCLKEYGDQGMPAPAAMLPEEQQMVGLDTRSPDLTRSGAIRAEDIDGTFRFKPRGSTENADISKQRTDYIQWLQTLPILMQTWPSMAMQLSQNLEAAQSALEQGLRLFRMPDKQAWLKPPPPPQIDPMTGQMMMQPGMSPGQPGQPGMGMNMPGMGAGMPPGMPPMGGAMMPPMAQPQGDGDGR